MYIAAEHLDLVRRVASNVRWKINGQAELDDLVGAGNVALVRCAATFDPTSAATFETYARYRIRGAMLDYLRTQDDLTRTERRRLGSGQVTFRFSALDMDGETPFSETILSRSPDPLQLLLGHEREQRVRDEINLLPLKVRQTMNLIVRCEMRQSQVAKRLGVSQAMISRRVTQGTKLLAASLAAIQQCSA